MTALIQCHSSCISFLPFSCYKEERGEGLFNQSNKNHIRIVDKFASVLSDVYVTSETDGRYIHSQWHIQHEFTFINVSVQMNKIKYYTIYHKQKNPQLIIYLYIVLSEMLNCLNTLVNMQYCCRYTFFIISATDNYNI